MATSAVTAGPVESDLENAREAEDDTITGSQEAFDTFAPRATGIAPAEREPYRGSLALVVHNLQTGLKNLRPHRAAVEERKGIVFAELEESVNYALALGWSLSKLRNLVPTPKQVSKMLHEIYGLRRLFLSALDACALKGLVPMAALDKIRAGQGPQDNVQDVSDLLALITGNAESLKNKTPLEPADLKRASELTSTLLLALKPKGADDKVEKSPEQVSLEAIRDGLWTLIVRRHAEMRKSGFLIWGDDVDQYVPQLLSRELPPRKKKAEAPKPA